MIRLTAREALIGSRAASCGLAEHGVSPGDRIVICVPPTPGRSSAEEHALLIQVAGAAVRSQATPVMINPAHPSAAQERMIADADAALSITTNAQMRSLVSAKVTGRNHDHGVFTARPMHYTSGTTGEAKGVWTGFLPAEMLTSWWTDEQTQWGFDRRDTTLVHGPLSSSAPLRHSLLVLAAGGDVLLPGSFDPVAIARSLAEDRPTTAFTVPSHWQRLFELPDLPPSPYRLLAHAGSACPADTKRQIHAWAGAEHTWEFYGSTEGQFSICSGHEWEEHPGTVGKARVGRRLFTRDATIWCETPKNSGFEYWRDPQKTSDAWCELPGGAVAFSVGDLGHIDTNGYLYLDGRRDDLIITGGMNVYPAHIEAALSAIRGVTEAAVFGIASPEWGQQVCAAIVGDASDAQISNALAESLAGYQRPKVIVRVDDLPRNPMGKVQRLELPGLLGLDKETR